MTLHPTGTAPSFAKPADPGRAVEEALRIARAASHSRKLERPIAEALDAIVLFGRSLVDRCLELEAALARAHARLDALEASGSGRGDLSS